MVLQGVLQGDLGQLGEYAEGAHVRRRLWRDNKLDTQARPEAMTDGTIPAIEDTSPVSHRSSVGENGGQALTALKEQLESAHFA